jgi:hypothetical protein
MLKFINILSLIFISSFISFNIAIWVRERFFFDQLICNKLEHYGYLTKKTSFEEMMNTKEVIKRVGDLKTMVIASQEELSISKKNDYDYQIAIIGDSLSYGIGVKNNQIYANLLEEQLNEHRKVKIYNLSLPGDNIIEHYYKYLLSEKYIQPDLYVIALVGNDLLLEGGGKYPGVENIYNDLNSICSIIKDEYKYDWSNTEGDWSKSLSQANYNSTLNEFSNSCFFEEIVKKMNKENVIFFGLDFAVLDNNISDSSNDESVLGWKTTNTFKNIVDAQNGYSLSPTKFGQFNYSPVSECDGHPSAETHEQYSNILYNEIIKNKKWNF